ncbi:citrate lyase holo-[acyl-carrier protein] synthase [Companilactobacillus sp.]|jgi:holo-ACP synthase|uniref:citrate lyase holo-[acyl-carrier protein] synthase n=1 Tax=Companilactobacillus sp. TaxID=2767905 RepID=UPI0025C57715|nr:citrate lyase holo-[acyl-carrier protein] synthase [Companilactobacillus sp.]MCH4008358.1 citrate lyase holo-[acyl-carrier protein] synthase [Companilactobacillus sp.]MCH4051463.1 citrate lyase holo-[acyl-carrier protein] synthase [Companilactobacillus sp.]MCH4076301.1 citrate lyase holo-[acyl-carrier protein] synthase [Companilactobacillus sp.]MCH4124876.1 citrate lyase holo-[acyl-carrier protein] synthase [Companilactobacillus sp.]MCH4131418.1 citrate lyase holo-[acyl-carrier protein] syn
MVNVFSEGYTMTDEQIKKGQEATLEEENYLIDEIPENCALVNITMRIPGRIKNNRYISRSFNLVVNDFLQRYQIVKEVLWDLSSGPQAFIIIQKDPGILKKETVAYENEQPLGNISDINVYAVEGDELSAITRKELGLPERKGIIADEYESEHKHSIEEYHEAIDKIINEHVSF